MTHNDALVAFLGPEIFTRLDWGALSDAQRAAILSVFRVGLNAGAASGSISTIESVMAKGQVIFCEDGSQWRALGEGDADLVCDWGEGALVAIHRNLIYRLDDYEAVEVEPLRL